FRPGNFAEMATSGRYMVKFTRTHLIFLLTGTTIGGAVLAWRQYAELVELRAIAMNREERADLNKRVWELEKANRELKDRLAAAQGSNSDETGSLIAESPGEQLDADAGRPGRGGNRGGPFRQAGAMRDLMNRPEVQALISVQQKARIDQTYAALFRNLNLSPEQAEKLRTLLAERQTTRMDIMEAGRGQGINPRDNPEAFQKLMTDARDQLESSIKSVVGESGYSQLQNYEQTLPQRGLVNDLQQRLSYSDTPLNSAQAERLVQILAATTPSSQAGTTSVQGATGSVGFVSRGGDLGMVASLTGGPGGGLIGAVFEGSRGAASVPITSEAVSQAQAVLSQPQVAALQQLQQQQLAQQQLAQAIRETITGGQQPSTSAGAANPGAGTSPTPQPRRPRNGGG
ncbi:MAG: hypothetical protein WD941_01070, partial [Opitutus sp.]